MSASGYKPIDFQNNEALNMVLQNLLSNPVISRPGKVYYNAVSEVPYYATDTEWIPMAGRPIQRNYASEATLLAAQAVQLKNYIYYREDEDVYYEYLGTVLGTMADYRPFSGSGLIPVITASTGLRKVGNDIQLGYLDPMGYGAQTVDLSDFDGDYLSFNNYSTDNNFDLYMSGGVSPQFGVIVANSRFYIDNSLITLNKTNQELRFDSTGVFLTDSSTALGKPRGITETSGYSLNKQAYSYATKEMLDTFYPISFVSTGGQPLNNYTLGWNNNPQTGLNAIYAGVACTITGIDLQHHGQRVGKKILIKNIASSGQVILPNQDTRSTQYNRFNFGRDIALNVGEEITVIYAPLVYGDIALQRGQWIVYNYAETHLKKSVGFSSSINQVLTHDNSGNITWLDSATAFPTITASTGLTKVGNDIRLGDANLIWTPGTGLVYGGDWETNFTPRSLVTQQYLTSEIIANAYTHPTFTPFSINTSAAQVIDELTTTSEGHVSGITLRNLTLADLGYTGATDANNYVHPSYTPQNPTLTGALVLASLVTDSIGSVVSLTTRTLTTSNIGAINIDQLGVANGVATLDSGGKLVSSQIPDSLLGGVVYIGQWNASTNTPTLPDPTTVKGNYYIVTVAGTQFVEDFNIGDWVISDGISWEKVDNTDAVMSVFGRIGNVVALATDYNGFYVRHDTAAQGLNGTQQSNARTNINAEQVIIGGATTITQADLTINRALISNGSGKVAVSAVTSTELEYVSGVTSSIQTQLNTKLSANQVITLSGDVTGSGATAIATTISNDAVTTTKILNSNVTYTKIQNVSANRILGQTAITGVVKELTAAEVRTIINVADGANNYVHPSKTWVDKTTLSGATIISNLTIDSLGHPTDWVTRTLTPADIDAEPAFVKGSIIQGAAMSVTGTLASRLVGTGDITIEHADTSSQASVVNTGGNIIQSVSVDTYGHVTSLGSMFGDDRWARRHVLIDSSSTWLYTSEAATFPGIHVGQTTTGSSNFPSTLGGFAIFGGAQTNSVSYFSRVFGFFREYDTTNVYVGTANDNGANNGWALIYTSYNLTLGTLGGVPTTRTITINGTAQDLSADRTWNVGTVTSVGMTVPTGLTVAGSPITSSGTFAVSLQAGYSIPTTAKQTEWDTAYTNRITSLTTTGNSGAATLTSNVLNIPNYTLAGLGGIGGSGTTNWHAKFTGTSIIGNSIIHDDGTNIGLGTSTVVNSKVTISSDQGTGEKNNAISFGTTRWFNVWHSSGYPRLGTFIEGNTVSNTMKWTHPTLRAHYISFDNGTLNFNYTNLSTGIGNDITGLATLVRFDYENQRVGIRGTTPTDTLDVNGTTRIRTLANATGNFVTTSATGVLQQRTASEVRTDLGLATAITGTIASGQVAFGTGANTVGGEAGFTYVSETKLLKIIGADSTGSFVIANASAGGVDQAVIRNNLGSVDMGNLRSANLNLITNNIIRWTISPAGILQSNGAQTIQTSTGNLTIATAAGNGNIILFPNGTGCILGGAANGNIISRFNNTSESAFNLQLRSVATGASTNTFKYGLYHENTENSTIGFWRGGSTIGGFITFNVQNGAEAIRITNSRNLLIDTTSDSGDKLRVNGTVRIDTINNLGTSATSVLVPSATGVVSLRTLTQFRGDLGATILGANLFTIPNPSAITFPRFNANNTVSALSASDFSTAIGAVPTTRTITINGVAQDLSADRSWTIPTHDAVTLGTTNGLSLVGQVLSLDLASSGVTGALSGTDWNTFNNKEPSFSKGSLIEGTNITLSGTLTNRLVGAGDITINADGQVPTRQVFVYSGSNTFSLSFSNPTAIYVALNGQVLEQGSLYDWTISGTTLTVTTPLETGDEISILYYVNLPVVTQFNRNIDGGFANSTYLPIQNIDGGTA